MTEFASLDSPEICLPTQLPNYPNLVAFFAFHFYLFFEDLQ